MIKSNKEGAQSYNSIFHNQILRSNKPRLNITKAIKEIEKRDKSFSHINNFEGRNKIMLQKYNTIDNNIFYSIIN